MLAILRSNILVSSKYINNKNARKYLRFVEWKAILRLVFDTDNIRMSEAFPDQATEVFNWHDKYIIYIERNANSPKARALRAIYLDLLNNKILNLDEFYLRLKADFTYPKIGKPLKNKTNSLVKNSGSNQFYNTKELTFVDNEMLVHLIIKNAITLANTNYSPVALLEVFNTLVFKNYKGQLTKEMLTILRGIFTKKVNAMEKSITRPEATILRHPITKLAKNTYHLYGLFKLQCEVGDTWELPLTELTKEQLGVGKPAALEAVDLLIKLKLIEISEPKKQQAANARATVYKRLK
jgi:hypothetical protein